MSTNNNVGLNGKGVGVPVKLMHESEGHVVTVRKYREEEESLLRLSILLSLSCNVFLMSSFFFARFDPSLFDERERENWKRFHGKNLYTYKRCVMKRGALLPRRLVRISR